jgi:hypothetical protein
VKKRRCLPLRVHECCSRVAGVVGVAAFVFSFLAYFTPVVPLFEQSQIIVILVSSSKDVIG